jgi:circadian clock protein KaiB
MDKFLLKLYISGGTANSERALLNLRQICADHLEGRYELEVVDVLKSPESAFEDKIVAIPTLIKRLPEPLRKVIGDLSDKDKVLAGLDIRQVTRLPESPKDGSA